MAQVANKIVARGGWRVRPAESKGDGKEVSLRRLTDAIANEEVGDLDEIRPPGDGRWLKIGEHPDLALYVPRDRRAIVKIVEDAESDMTPMIDVTFQLLIFFMICATYVVQKSLNWPSSKPDPDAAATVTLEELDRSHVLVHVNATGGVSVDGTATSLDQLEHELRSAIEKTGSAEILLDVEDDAKHDVVAQVLDSAGAANVEQILYVSRSSPGQPASGGGPPAGGPPSSGPPSSGPPSSGPTIE